MIYAVSRNGIIGTGYKGKVSQPNKVKDLVIKHTPLYSHFTTGKTHDKKYTSKAFYAKPKFKQNFGNSNSHGPRKLWVPKDYVVDIFNSKVETPVLTLGLWMLSTHGGKKAYVPNPRI